MNRVSSRTTPATNDTTPSATSSSGSGRSSWLSTASSSAGAPGSMAKVSLAPGRDDLELHGDLVVDRGAGLGFDQLDLPAVAVAAEQLDQALVGQRGHPAAGVGGGRERVGGAGELAGAGELHVLEHPVGPADLGEHGGRLVRVGERLGGGDLERPALDGGRAGDLPPGGREVVGGQLVGQIGHPGRRLGVEGDGDGDRAAPVLLHLEHHVGVDLARAEDDAAAEPREARAPIASSTPTLPMKHPRTVSARTRVRERSERGGARGGGSADPPRSRASGLP